MDLLERDEALDAFSAALRDVAAGRGRALLVRGEAGIGKTALVRHALATRAEGARVLLSGCDDLATARTLGPFRDLAPHVHEALAGPLRDGAPLEDIVEPLLAELGRPPRPVVLVVDDVHWADQASLDLLAYVLRRLDRVAVLLVLTFRDALDHDHPLRGVIGRLASPHAVHVDLAPLSRASVAALGGREDAEDLWQRTRGNPFLVTALTRHEDDSVPPSVQDAVLAELVDLDEGERGLVELTAVVPGAIEVAVLDAARPGWEEHGVRPERRGLLEFREGQVGFRHELARQAVLESLPTARRRALHRDVLAVLRDQHDDPSRLVHHAIGADDVPTLLQAGPAAAAGAARAGAHRQALEHYERLVPHDAGLALPDRAALWYAYAAELMTNFRLDDSLDAFTRALALHEEAGDVRGQGRTLSFLAGLAGLLHRPDEADEFEREAIRRLEADGPSAELAHAWVCRAGHHMVRWEFDDAEDWGRRAITMAEGQGDRQEAAYARNMLGTAMVTRGDVEAGLAELDASIATASEVRAYNLVSLGYSNAAEALLDVGRPDLARPYVEEGRRLADRHETRAVGGYLAAVHARWLATQGRWDEAVELARTTWSGGPMASANHVVAGMAIARAMLRRGDDVSSLLAELTAVGRRRREMQYLGAATVLRAEAAWLAGAPAPDDLLDVLDTARGLGQPWLVGELTTWGWRLGVLIDPSPEGLPDPLGLVLAGDPVGASAAWATRGYPYEAALVLIEADQDRVLEAVEAADLLGAVPLAARLRQRLRELGVRRIPRGPQSATRENPAGLTDRQLEVLRHVAAGRTNAEIAEALVLSVRTVDHHVSATLAKLGVASRHDAAVLAAELGVVPTG